MAALIAIVQGAQQLSEVIVRFWKARRSPKKQTLRLKTALGVVTIELDDDADPETVCRMLEPLFAG